MSDVDLMNATQAAVIAALQAGAPSGWPVFDSVPQGTNPNFIKLGAISETSEDEKSEDLERFTVEIQTIYRGEDRTILIAAMHAVRKAVDPKRGAPDLQAEGANFPFVRFLDAHASDPAADGVTYAGITNFEVYCEPA